ncbi:CRISPR-associated endonuclease Cas6 [Nitrososphaera viennensis]|uniref:CRISPR-associated endonuclease Cas6 n=2 Tax=Nitrososphaera viennensis TaxID=1034015 RepID=A0A977NKQ5_9ARCH|nr:CRISPR-associated endonuclease Cas6 [Nitrososphaera viennensis]AIC15994.1 putative CRISPR-associated protein [Nitrososphaera viennensis EN76]UVS67969.1 CRISPR-associated endonuclease Cas6 [Nitrososphaera viennensis]
MDKIEVCYAYIEVPDASTISAVALRGFLGYLFVEDTEFHHHSDSPYHYPLVQYKKVRGRLMVMGLKDYAEVVCRKMSTLDHITTPNGRINVQSVDLVTDSFSVKEETRIRFRFATPWIALNEENYQKFRNLESAKKKAFLEKILVGNVLSAIKGLSVFAKFKVTADLETFRPQRVFVHENQFQAFRASFTTNVNLPRFFGLGKSVSKGFGAIESS